MAPYDGPQSPLAARAAAPLTQPSRASQSTNGHPTFTAIIAGCAVARAYETVVARADEASGAGLTKVPGAGIPEATGAGTPEAPGAGTPEAPGAGIPDTPGAGGSRVKAEPQEPMLMPDGDFSVKSIESWRLAIAEKDELQFLVKWKDSMVERRLIKEDGDTGKCAISGVGGATWPIQSVKDDRDDRRSLVVWNKSWHAWYDLPNAAEE
ncbi:hypothetical protein LTR53_016826, partial [Teratosphaeriaceae sp. CCFEE 6253]